MRSLLLISFLFCLVSCMGGSGGGSSSSSSSSKIVTSISDSTLVSFQQTSGVAKTGINWMDLVIARAYAAVGDISCFSGQNVSFDMDIQIGPSVENIQVDAVCGDDIELRIRRGMLQALDGHILVRERGQAPTGSGYWLDFSAAEGFQFGVPYTILDKEGWAGVAPHMTSRCFVDYTFNFATGKVSNGAKTTSYANRALERNTYANNNYSVSNPNAPQLSNNYVGCNTANVDFGESDFRFKNGKIEIDESGTKRFNANGCALWDDNTGSLVDYKENGVNGVCPDAGYDSTFERFCIDNDANGSCDNI